MTSDRKGKKVLFFLVTFAFCISQKHNVVLIADDKIADKIEVRRHFSCYHCNISWSALKDLESNPIFNACLDGATLSELEKLGIKDLNKRLEALQNGNLLKKTGEKSYGLAFPAIVGEKRTELQQIIEQTAEQLMPSVEDAVKQLRHHLNQQPEMLFHVLWSIVMDGVAWQTVQTEFEKQFNKNKVSLKGVSWLTYPSHPYGCGTNTYNDLQIGTVKITWSMTTALTSSAPWVLHETIKKYENQLIKSAINNKPIQDQQTKQALAQYGLIDDEGTANLFIVDPNSPGTPIYYNLGLDFGRQAMTHLDVQKVSDILDVTPKQAVVVAYHELCYEILKQLAEKGAIRVPEILLNPQAGTSQTHHLISIIKRVNDPNSLKYPQK